MSEPAVTPLTLQRGVDNAIGVEIEWEDDDGNVAPVLLTDCVLTLRAWSSFGGEEVLSLSTGAGNIVVVDAAAGLADVLIGAADTAAAIWRTGEYVLDLTLADATPLRLARGPLTLQHERGES